MMKIGIIGLGLMGGSLAKALKIRYNNPFIVAANRSEDTLIKAYQDKIIDGYCTEVNEIFSDCNIIFICTPVSKIVGYVNKLLPYISKDCILTDVGSTKGSIVSDIEKLADKVCFIGGHPMTGSEQTRYTSAKESLYENAYYILAPVKSVPNDKLELLIDIVTKIGAIPVVLSPSQHDHIVAAISHVPHIIAAAIVNLVNRLDNDRKSMHTLAAGGFKDITRIASSSPEMWQNISQENKTEILNILKEFKTLLGDFENTLLSDDSEALLDYFQNAKNYRDSFSNRNIASFNKYYEVLVDILDQTGAIATIATLLSVNNINIKNIGIINNREYQHGVLQVLFDNEETWHKSIQLLKKMNYTVYTK